VVSASLVVFVLRTRLPFARSHPSRGMLIMTGIGILIALAVPFSPVAGLLGFKALPPYYLLTIAIIVLAYLGFAEVTKRLFCRRVELQ
jgi:Mg2+-importing ATPase